MKKKRRLQKLMKGQYPGFLNRHRETIFLFFNFARLKVIKSNFVYEIVCDVSFVIGINIFVFTQRDTARFQVLILSAYLCCLYLLNIRDLLRKI